MGNTTILADQQLFFQYKKLMRFKIILLTFIRFS